MEKREKLLYLAITVAVLGTASLYLLSASMENQSSVHSLPELMKDPEKYAGKDMDIEANITDIKNYGGSTVFYLEDAGYHLRSVCYENITIRDGRAVVHGYLKYEEKWGNYEFVVKSVRYGS